LKNVFGIHGAASYAISGPENVIVMLSVKKFDLIGRTRNGSEVFYGLHSFLLHFVSSHKTPLREGLLTNQARLPRNKANATLVAQRAHSQVSELLKLENALFDPATTSVAHASLQLLNPTYWL
jgi:hypothetical protein